MTGHFRALYLDENEYTQALELNKRVEVHYRPYLVIRVVSHLTDTIFEGIISRSTADYDRSKALTRHNTHSDTLVKDYYEKKTGVFTFDGIRFFRIINIAVRTDEEALMIFTFQFLSSSTFLQKDTAFMIMPFKYPELNAFYEKNIKDYLADSELNIKVFRSDDFKGTDVVADTILDQIKKVEFIICDITNCNKNVFFEIGYAKGLNKDIIFLLEQNKPHEFFDVTHIRRIEYSFEREEAFQKLLKDTLITVRNNRII